MFALLLLLVMSVTSASECILKGDNSTTAQDKSEPEAWEADCPIAKGWTLVRRVQRGGAWHPATDRCDGSEAYNAEQRTKDPTADVTFSILFEEAVPDYDEVMFTTGDCQVWLITTKDAVGGPFNGQYYDYEQRQILASSNSDSPYTAAWYNRQGTSEDPWISVIDHASAISAGMLVYGEGSFNWATHTQVLQDHNGANVFVRKKI
jgi:hypothetical protein